MNSRQGFRSILEIVERINTPTLIIISAFDKATQRLAYLASVAEKGQKTKAMTLLKEIFDEHKKFSRLILTSQDDIIELFPLMDEEQKSLGEIINGITLTKELSPRLRDLVLSYGEKLALLISKYFFKHKGIRHTIVDARDIIVTDEHFGRARPIESKTAENVKKILMPALKKDNIVIMQGFVAKSKKGETTTMGLESSNLTAALMAKLLNLKKIVFWTDVCGIRNFDPSFVDNTKLIQTLNYDDAFRLGKAGLKLIYPGMIDYVRDNGIELVYKSPFCEKGEQTVVKKTHNYTEPVIVATSGGILNIVRCKTDAQIYKSLDIMRNTIFNKIVSFNYFKIKDNEFVFFSLDVENFEKEFKGMDYQREENMAFITLFNVPFEKYSSLIIRHRKAGKNFPAIVKFIDFNDDFVLIGIKQRNVRRVLEFFNHHIEALVD